MKDKSMKKWIAYKSLIEQEIEIRKMRVNREKIDKPEIFDDKVEEINNILVNYHDEELTIQYYDDGYLYNITDKIKKIDSYQQFIILKESDLKIKFSDIIDILY